MVEGLPWPLSKMFQHLNGVLAKPTRRFRAAEKSSAGSLEGISLGAPCALAKPGSLGKLSQGKPGFQDLCEMSWDSQALRREGLGPSDPGTD